MVLVLVVYLLQHDIRFESDANVNNNILIATRWPASTGTSIIFSNYVLKGYDDDNRIPCLMTTKKKKPLTINICASNRVDDDYMCVDTDLYLFNTQSTIQIEIEIEMDKAVKIFSSNFDAWLVKVRR